MKLKRQIYRLLLGVSLIIASGFSAAEGEDPLRVKAAYLFKLAQFAEWPVELAASDSFQLCMLGDNIIRQVAVLMENEKIKGHPVQVVDAKLQSDLSTCRILYIDAAESWRINTVMAILTHYSTLTISDADNFCSSGGIISLVMEGDRLKFEVNQTAALESDLKISSRILKMAKKVY